MINRKKRLKNNFDSEEMKDLCEQLKKIKPQTELGKSLLKLSRKNLENGIVIWDADEIMNELGRPEYE